MGNGIFCSRKGVLGFLPWPYRMLLWYQKLMEWGFLSFLKPFHIIGAGGCVIEVWYANYSSKCKSVPGVNLWQFRWVFKQSLSRKLFRSMMIMQLGRWQTVNGGSNKFRLALGALALQGSLDQVSRPKSWKKPLLGPSKPQGLKK